MTDATEDECEHLDERPAGQPRPTPPTFGVVAAEGAEARAADVAARLGVPLLGRAGVDASSAGSADEALHARFDPRVRLRIAPEGEASELVGPNAEDGAVRIPRHALGDARPGRDPLLRAVLAGERPPPHVIDATAGLGADAFVVAASGCRVTALERNPALAFLLEEALALAASDPALAEAARRVTVVAADARRWLRERPGVAPIVVLDPMYPLEAHGARRLRRVGKAMRLFRALVGDDPDADALLAAARGAARRRVVVKRPRRAEPLAGAIPSGSIEGRTTRFDLYAPRPPDRPHARGSEARGSSG